MASKLNNETDKLRRQEGQGYDPKPLIWVAIIVAIVGMLFFAIHRFYSLARPIDGSLWGEFGDYIGGVVGTIIAYISIRLLVATLKTQTQSNDIATGASQRNTRATSLQLLTDQFKMMVDLYREALGNIKQKGDDKLKGQQYLKVIKKKMLEEYQSQAQDYASRKKDAVALFEKFYVEHRDTASVYFRLIYRLLQIIFNQDLDSTDKAPFAKMLRCQFTEEELFFIRYNAMTSNGKNIRKLLNQYNIQKHLPELSLLEFKFWYDFIDVNLHSEVITYLISLRKTLIKYDKQNEIDEIPPIGGRYTIEAAMQDDRKKYTLTLCRNLSESPSTEGLPAAFERFSRENLRDFLDDVLHELVIYYSFEINQTESDLIFEKNDIFENNSEIVTAEVTMTNPDKEIHLYVDYDPS